VMVQPFHQYQHNDQLPLTFTHWTHTKTTTYHIVLSVNSIQNPFLIPVVGTPPTVQFDMSLCDQLCLGYLQLTWISKAPCRRLCYVQWLKIWCERWLFVLLIDIGGIDDNHYLNLNFFFNNNHALCLIWISIIIIIMYFVLII